jgi:DNA recombination protein RmuC
MELTVILGIIIIALLLAGIALQIIGRKKSDIGEITTLLKRTADEQRDSVAKQISAGATEQFARFGVIQESVQTTLQASREEQAKQMREFAAQVDKLNASVTATLQASRAETNEQLGKFSTGLDARLSAIQEQTQKTLQTSREEQSKKLHEFGEQVDSRLSSIQRGNTENIEKVNATLESKMKSIQESNE